MKYKEFPILLQPFRLDDFDTLISIANGDVFYGSAVVEAAYELCVFSPEGWILHQSQFSINPFQKIVISLAQLNLDCNSGLFTLKKLSGISSGHFYTTFKHLKGNNSFVVHSHQVFDWNDPGLSHRLYIKLLNALSFRLNPSLKSLRKIAIPPIGDLSNKKIEIFVYNKSTVYDKLYIAFVDNQSRIFSRVIGLPGHHSRIISVSHLLKTVDLEVSGIYLKPMYGYASSKPLIFHYSRDNKLICLHHA